jgi:hypothetical protein
MNEYLPLVIVLTILIVAIIYMRRPGKAPRPKTWLDPRAFVVATLLMALVQTNKMMTSGFSLEAIIVAILSSIFGGVFWGAIGTYFYNRSKRQP